MKWKITPIQVDNKVVVIHQKQKNNVANKM